MVLPVRVDSPLDNVEMSCSFQMSELTMQMIQMSERCERSDLIGTTVRQLKKEVVQILWSFGWASKVE